MALVDLARLRDAPLSRDPFEFVVVENFLDRDSLPALVHAFPAIADHGSYPLPALAYRRRLDAEVGAHALADVRHLGDRPDLGRVVAERIGIADGVDDVPELGELLGDRRREPGHAAAVLHDDVHGRRA